MTAPTSESLLAVLAELERLRALTVDVAARQAPKLWPPPTTDASGPERTLYDLLTGARRAVMGNPAGAKALLGLLVAEGRRYAETEAGRRLRDGLVASEAVDHLRRIWETVTLNVLDGAAPPSGVPDAWIELLTDAIAGESLDDVLARLRPEGFA